MSDARSGKKKGKWGKGVDERECRLWFEDGVGGEMREMGSGCCAQADDCCRNESESCVCARHWSLLTTAAKSSEQFGQTQDLPLILPFLGLVQRLPHCTSWYRSTAASEPLTRRPAFPAPSVRSPVLRMVSSSPCSGPMRTPSSPSSPSSHHRPSLR